MTRPATYERKPCQQLKLITALAASDIMLPNYQTAFALLAPALIMQKRFKKLLSCPNHLSALTKAERKFIALY
jgi:hypothetical protein